MKKYLTEDEWSIVEDGFAPEKNRLSEGTYALGNGKMSLSGDFEEMYSGNGHRDVPNFVGIDIYVDGEIVNMYICKVIDYHRELNMREGYVERRFCIETMGRKTIRVSTQRILSMADKSMAAIRYSICPVNFTGKISIVPYIDGGNRKIAEGQPSCIIEEMNMKSGYASMLIVKDNATEAYSMRYRIMENKNELNLRPELIKKEAWVGNRVDVNAQGGTTITIEKYVGCANSGDVEKSQMLAFADTSAMKAMTKGFDRMMEEHREVLRKIWSDVEMTDSDDIYQRRSVRLKLFKEISETKNINIIG